MYILYISGCTHHHFPLSCTLRFGVKSVRALENKLLFLFVLFWHIAAEWISWEAKPNRCEAWVIQNRRRSDKTKNMLFCLFYISELLSLWLISNGWILSCTRTLHIFICLFSSLYNIETLHFLLFHYALHATFFKISIGWTAAVISFQFSLLGWMASFHLAL